MSSQEVQATLRSLRCSPRKVALVAGLIRGMNVNQALVQLAFSHKGVAQPMKKLLQSAIANAENNHGLDIDSLYVDKVLVGRGLVMKRFHARARGRAAKVIKPFSNVTIILSERKE